MLKSTFSCSRIRIGGGLFGPVCALVALIACATPAATVAQDNARSDLLKQVAGILDYVASDYAGAVDASGRVLDQGELDEQIQLAREAKALASRAGIGAQDPVQRELDALLRELAAKSTPGVILARARGARETLVRTQGVVLAPRERPDRARGRALFASQGCPVCHGADGRADTPAARALTPRPASFMDPARVAGVSPYRAYFAISYGIRGTGMAAFPQLSDADRWDLAFHVLALRHERDNAAIDRGRAALARAGTPITPVAATLSAMTEEDVLHALAPKVHDRAERDAVLAYLRARAPFEAQAQGASTLAVARRKLHDGVDAYRRGDRDRARRIFVSAYLDGFEPNEAALRARDAELVARVEREMLALREAAASGAPAAAIERRVHGVLALLDRAERSQIDGGATFVGSMAIALREGFEAALLVLALLGLVRKRGLAGHAKFVHAGWLAAVPVGLLTWVAVGQALGGLERELAEGIISLIAAVVLLGVTHWIVGQLSAKQWMGFLSKRLAGATGRGAAWAVFALAFIAAYREAFEIVLFYKAMLLDAQSPSLVWLGAASGLALLAAMVLLLKRLGQRLQPRPFMLASSVLLALLSLVLVGKGVHALQEAGVVAMTAITGMPEVAALGVYATIETVVAQAGLLALLTLSALWPWITTRRAGAAQPTTSAAPR